MQLVNPKSNTQGNPIIHLDVYSKDADHGVDITADTQVEFFIGRSASMDGDAIGAVVRGNDGNWTGFVYQTRYRTFKAWSFATEAEAKDVLFLHIHSLNRMLDETVSQFTGTLPATQIRSIADAGKVFSPIIAQWAKENNYYFRDGYMTHHD